MSISPLLVVLFSLNSWGFFGEIMDAAEKAGAAGAIIDATADLYEEIDANDPLTSEMRALSDRQNEVARNAQNVSYLGREIKEFLKAPDLTGKRIDHGIRATTSFLRKGKMLAASLAALGPQSASAVANLQTSATLNSILANQSAQMAEEKRDRIFLMQSEVEKQKANEEFIRKNRELRRAL